MSASSVFASRTARVALCVTVLAALAPPAQTEVAKPRPVAPRGELTAEERATIDMFERSKRSVVSITTRDRVVDLWTRNVHTIPRGTGSGIVWDEQGHVVTNYHVIAGAADTRVRLNDGRDFAATLVGASPAHDLAVLRIVVTSDRPPPVLVGTSRDLRVGQRVFAIGNPFGLDWSLSTGIVSALDRSLAAEERSIEHLIQTDAAINPGNSGGPLLDSAGRLIGVSTAIYSPSGVSAGIGFAVPVDTVNRVVPQLIATGRYTRPVLGIAMDEDLNATLSSRLGVQGVFVLKVAPHGPAANAGLRALRVGDNGSVSAGDVIVAVDDKPVESVARLLARLDDYAPNDRVRLTVLREGKRVTVEAVLGADR